MKFCPRCGAPMENKEKCECEDFVYEEKEETKKKNPLMPDFVDEWNHPNQNLSEFDLHMNQIYVNKLQAKENVANSIKLETISLEDFLYTQYKGSNITKDEFVSILNEILDMKTEEHIKNVIDKISKEE